jgi:hypothetical protein
MGRRNLQGGNKTKGMARSNGRQQNELRCPEGDEEEYAIISAVSGNGRFRMINENKKQYVGILPGSMRGNKKRNNYVELNSVVLINNRSSWQTAKEMSQADIVHVYSSMHIRELKLHEKFQEQLNKHNNNGSILDKNYITFDNNATTVDEKKKEIIAIEEEEEEDDIDYDNI